MKKTVLGVNIDDINMDQAVEIVEKWLRGKGPASPAKRGEKHYIVTPNPEFLVAAQKDNVFRKILNEADLSIPDGVGLKLSGKIKNTVYGIDLMERLVSKAADYGFTVGFLGGAKGVAEKCAECLLQKYPKLKISYMISGGIVNEKGESENKSLPKVDILFVAFGHIKQEKWIAQNLNKLDVKVAMGVGGAFDFLSGKVPRAPEWIRNLGFEWLFRLIVQPWRIKRQMSLIKYLLMLS